MSLRSPLSAVLRVLAAAVVALPLLAASAAAQGRLVGDFYGIDEAEGASLRVRGGDGAVSGRLVDPAGIAQDFTLPLRDGGAEGVVEIAGEPTLLRLDTQPFGTFVSLVPVAADGTKRTAEAELFTFVRRDLELPEPPQGYLPPPETSGRRFGASSFLVSYAFWPPGGVSAGYAALAPRHRTMIALFPAVQLDVIWKLCLAPEADRALGMALRGQGVDCGDVQTVIARTQEAGTFDDFKAEVAEQADVLRVAMRCADNYVASKETCDAAARAVSEQAVSLETAATVLERYR